MMSSALPQLDLTIGGQRLSEAGALVEVRVDQRLSLPSSCELVIEPHSAATLELGALGERIELRVGGPGGRLLFCGECCSREVTHVAGAAPRLSLRAYDAVINLARTQHVRAHVGVTPGDLLDELARGANLRVSTDERGPVHAYIVQDRQTDLALCSDICGRAGLYFFFAQETLELFPLSRREPEWKPESVNDVLRLELTRSNVAAPIVKAFGWHPRSNEVCSAKASSAVDVLGQRILAAHGVDDSAQAEATARASAERNTASASVARAVCAGDPALRPGVRVYFEDHAGADARGYLVCRAIHHIAAQTGFVTEISSEPPPRPENGSGASVALGIISQVDPGRFVAKVRLPAMENVETDWMKIVSPGGSAKVGLFLMPRVEDVVLVVCADGDAGRGIIVGGLIDDGGPDLPATRDELPFQLRTRAGATIELSDEAKTMRFEDPRGNRLVFDAQGIDLLARGDLQIRAPGKTITIAAARVDFKKVEGEP